MRVLIGDIPGGYDADTLHAEIDRRSDIKPYVVWWPERPGDPIRVEIEGDAPLGTEAVVRVAAAAAALATPKARADREATNKRASMIDLEVRRAAAERLGLVEEERALAEEIAKLRGGT